MNSVTHTPGQWVAEQCGPDEYAIRRHLSPTTAERIATVKSIDPLGTAEANARAIAALPDLLDALRLNEVRSRSWCAACEGSAITCDADKRGCPNKIARAAIAKAEGRTE